jgi:hypothetical protein
MLLKKLNPAAAQHLLSHIRPDTPELKNPVAVFIEFPEMTVGKLSGQLLAHMAQWKNER